MTDTIIVIESNDNTAITVGYGTTPESPIAESLLVWRRVTNNTNLTEQYEALDVFPSANGVVIKLPNPALFVQSRIDVHNQTDTFYTVVVKDHNDIVLQVLQPSNAYSFYFTPLILAWEQVHLSGESIGTLPLAPYANFDAIEWSSLATGKYTMTGLGSQFAALPTGSTLLPSSTYTYTIAHTNVAGNYSDNVFFGTNSDFTNNYLGRPCIRSGYDFGSSAAVGWKIVGFKAEQTYSLDAQKRSASAINMPTTDNVVFVWDNKVSEFGADGAGYNATTGEFTCPFTGAYLFVFRFNTTANSGTKAFSAGAEVWNGSAWVASEWSCVVEAIRSGDVRQAVFTSPVRFTKGLRVRFVFWAATTVSIANVQPAGTTRFTVPAARLMILGTESQ